MIIITRKSIDSRVYFYMHLTHGDLVSFNAFNLISLQYLSKIMILNASFNKIMLQLSILFS